MNIGDITRYFMLVALILFLYSCAVHGEQKDNAAPLSDGSGSDHKRTQLPGNNDEKEEVLYGVSFAPDRITFRVASGGCTKKEHFKVKSDREGGVRMITLLRVRRDFCKALLQGGITMVFTMEEMGMKSGDSVRLTNGFSDRANVHALP